MLLIISLLVPALGRAGDRTRLSRAKATLHRVQHQVSRFSRAASSVKKKIDQANVRLAVLQVQVNRLSDDVAAAREAATEVQAKVDSLRKKEDAVRTLARSQAIAIYESGPTGTLGALLDSRSLSQLGDRMEMLDVATKSNTKALIEYTRLSAEIKDSNRELLAARTDLAKRLQAKQLVQQRISATSSELRSKLATLHSHVADRRDKERGLAAQSKRLTKQLARDRAMASVSSLGVSKRDYIWPLNGAINSPYGPRWGSFHPGVDIDGYTGEPYMAAHSGVVLIAGWIDGYGNAVVIDTGGGVQNVYGHSSALRVSAGDHVKQGDVLGLVGCTGYCTGPHLHFEIRVNGQHVDPMPFLPHGSDDAEKRNLSVSPDEVVRGVAGT